MMARKAMLFGDLKTLDAIMAAKKPWEHKALGRVVCGFTEEQWKQYAAPLWEEHCDDIVFQGNWFTSQYCEEYRDVLLASGDKHIVEGSAQDKIWGVGVSWDDPAILDPANWRGGPNNNRLGKAHMKVRHHWRELLEYRRTTGDLEAEFDVWTKQIIKV